MVTRIISGGQTGADQAGLEAAAQLRIPTGGHMPKGWRTEAGARPDLAERYGLEEAATGSYPGRTELNVAASDGTVIFGDATTGGSKLTRELADRYGRPCLVLPASAAPEAAARDLAAWLAGHSIETLNVAGNRESQAPGIGRFVIDVLTLALPPLARPDERAAP